MLLKTFDLRKSIKLYNQQNNTSYPEESTFEFKYFDKQYLSMFNKLIELINNAHELCIYNEKEALFIKKFNNELRSTLDDFNGSNVRNSSKHGGILKYIPYSESQITALNSQIQLKDNWFKWLDTNFKILNEKFIENNIGITDPLYQEAVHWKKQCHFARCNDTAIFRVSREIQTVFDHIQKAKKKLRSNKHHIPTEICRNYKKYLSQLEKDINSSKTAIIESMLIRLKALDSSKCRYSNPILHTAISLNPNLIYPKQPYIISAEEFSFFHNYVELNGNLEHKNELYKRSWFTSNTAIPTTTINSIDNGTIIVPSRISNLIPVKRRWPNWFFRDDIKQNIFKESILLISNLSFQDNRPEYFIDIHDPLSVKEPLNELKHNELLIDNELTKITKPPITEVSWYSFGTKNILRKWNEILIAQQRNLIDKKFALAERIINNLKSKAISPMDIPWESYEILLNLARELEDLVNIPSNKELFQERIFFINSTIAKFAPLNRFLQILKTLSDGMLPTNEQIDYIHRFIESRSKAEPNFLGHFRKSCKTQLNLIFLQCYKLLKMNPFNIRNRKDQDDYEKLTVALFSILDKTNMIINNEDYTNRVYKFTLNYLQNLYLTNTSNIPDNLARIKNIISIIAKDINFCGEPISNHVNTLTKLKAENSLLFKINCKSIIITLSNYLLKQHFDKELLKFDDHMVTLLKQADLSDEVISVLINKRNMIIKTGDYDNINLTPSERSIFDVNLPNSSHKIISLLKMNAKAHLIKNQLYTSNNPEEKPMLVKKLSKSIYEHLGDSSIFTNPVSKNLWFSKQYINDSLLSHQTIHNQLKI